MKTTIRHIKTSLRARWYDYFYILSSTEGMVVKMKLTLNKVLAINIITLLLVLCTKIWYCMDFNKIIKGLYNQFGVRMGLKLTEMHIQTSNDTFIIIPDFSIYIIVIGIIINLIIYIVEHFKK